MEKRFLFFFLTFEIVNKILLYILNMLDFAAPLLPEIMPARNKIEVRDSIFIF